MTTRLGLRTSLRERLEDTGDAPLWSGGALHEFLGQAIRVYVVQIPTQSTAATGSIAAAATSVALPAGVDADEVVSVRNVASETVPRFDDKVVGAEPLDSRGIAQEWMAWGIAALPPAHCHASRPCWSRWAVLRTRCGSPGRPLRLFAACLVSGYRRAIGTRQAGARRTGHERERGFTIMYQSASGQAAAASQPAKTSDPGPAAAPASCCSPVKQASCCEPSEKAACCGEASAQGCGCQ